MDQLLYPPPLVRGDTIMIVAPAGRLDQDRVESARKRLEEMGFKVRVPATLFRTRGYLAGEDAERADELMEAFRDPAVKAILPGTGGYGCTRILDRLDYDVIADNAKILEGFSDITGLHLAIHKKTGLVTFHGPNLMYGLGSSANLSPFSARYLWRAICGREEPTTSAPAASGGYAIEVPDAIGEIRTLAPGVARGRLIGGNLSLISATMGTPYEIETEGRILFAEDVDERPYRIDRFFSQLRLAGKLERLAGVILGQFTSCEPHKAESLSLEQVLLDYFKNLGVPVISNFPAGHHRQNATLAVGGLYEVNADDQRVTLLESPIRLETRE